ncbi:MAG TPA: energy transducer TonB [Terriglobales bacterium]|nr:energy transducer TonB [Terriglobales bacterium]
MNGRILRKTLLAALFFVMASSCTALHAQKTEKTLRKRVASVDPVYPELLRRSNIGGVVRLLVVISPKGTVETVNQLGGNAALLEAAVTAVKKWKYAPADIETTQEVSITFDPHSYH